MTILACSTIGCDRDAAIAKLCTAHYNRLRRHGDVQAHKPLRRRNGAPAPKCSIKSCATASHVRGLCGAHYSRWLKTGDANEGDPVATWGREPDTCSIGGCQRDVRTAGMCGAHYERVKYTGGPMADKPIKGEQVEGMAWCAHHHELLPLERFAKNARTLTGADAYCRECKGHLNKTKYAEAIKRSSERWRAANTDKMGGYKRGYLAKYPERRKQSSKTYGLNRRSRLLDNGGEATAEQVAARWAYYGNKCWICRGSADSTDHMKPVSKGGQGWPSNLRPICRSCNSTKSNQWPYTLEVALGRTASHREVTTRAT